jgi:hypothetical protein
VPFIPLARALPNAGHVGRGDRQLARRLPGGARRARDAAGRPRGRADFADDTIELTNALAPGDSGGPVVTRAAKAVGVVSYISFNPGGMRSDTPVPPFLMGLPLPREFAAVRRAGGDRLRRWWRRRRRRGARRAGDRLHLAAGVRLRPGAATSTSGRGRARSSGRWRRAGPASAPACAVFEERPVLDDEGNRVGSGRRPT